MSVKRALISLSDKTGIIPFAKGLHQLGVEILSTGGTAKLLRENAIPVVEVGDYTGQPEILDGRLKTLHPKIHGGILGMRSNPQHVSDMKKSEIQNIDLIIVNLYPFEQTIAQKDVTLEHAIENIDIGGPTMIRAAAKNWQDVAVVVDYQDYEKVLEEMKKGEISKETKFELAKKVFVLTSRYDGAIANYLTGGKDRQFPQTFNFQFQKVQELRYGENPHQKAAFYKETTGDTSSQLTHAKQLHGKELSFNNILDLDAAFGLVLDFEEPACVIVKHTTPCGVATSDQPKALSEIFIAARECDPLSAFGGIIAFNRPVDVATAQEISKDFYECVIAPSFQADAFQIIAGKKNIRIMELPSTSSSPQKPVLDLKKVSGGLLVQEKDLQIENVRHSKVVSKRQPSDTEWKVLQFAWTVCRGVKSNAIVYAGSEGDIIKTLGIGGGQVSRVDATKIGISKARTSLKGAVMASDAFFPFRDNIDEAAKAGVAIVVQPGGSMRDDETIAAVDEHGMTMLFTGARHFRH